MLFRIEDISGFDPNLRKYDVDEYTASLMVDKTQIDDHIASKIREEINGSKNRALLSYSKSLATCILKYNKFTDNELHICDINNRIDYIKYVSLKGNERCKRYSLQDRVSGRRLFNRNGKIQLLNFIIDVSNNALVDEYLRYYTSVGRKSLASPEKDSEVVVLIPPNDLVINQYMDAVYILYALQLKYKFLSDRRVPSILVRELSKMDEFRFGNCPNERVAFIKLIWYLSANWRYENQISQQIYTYSENDEHFPMHYDPILQFHGIMTDDFDVSYNLGSYNNNALSDLFWKYCYCYLKSKT